MLPKKHIKRPLYAFYIQLSRTYIFISILPNINNYDTSLGIN